MLSIRSRLSLKVEGRVATLRSSPGRRIGFFVVGLVLLLSFLVGVSDEGTGGQAGHPAGTVFYFALLGASFAVAGWNQRTRFDAGEGVVRGERRLFGIPLQREEHAAESVQAIVLQDLALLDDMKDACRSERMRQYLERRRSVYRLLLHTEQGARVIEESAERSELESVGSILAELMGTDFREEHG